MRHASYKSTEDRVLMLAGIKPSDRTDEMRALLNSYINTAMKLAWEFYWWPELMRSELRYYRDPYDGAKPYAPNDQVYYPTTQLYYTCLVASTGNLPTDANYWEVANELDAYIELEQLGQTPLGEVRGVFVDDPLATERPRYIRKTLGPHGVHLQGPSLPVSAWVLYRIRPNEYIGKDFDAVPPYAPGQTAYYNSATVGFEGDYWKCVTATNAGENPETHPAKWARIELPSWLKEAVAGRAFAEYLITDGAPFEVTNRAAAFADGLLIQAVHLFVGQQGQSIGRVA